MEGEVILDATIDKQGLVTDLRVLRSIPVFDAAAVEAVAQWRYAPTVVGGEPVEVFLSVTVNFSLGGPERGAKRPIEIKQDGKTLKVKRPMGSRSSTATYRFNGSETTNDVMEVPYTYVSHWDGPKLVTRIVWTSSMGPMESVETMWLEGDTLIVDLTRPGGTGAVPVLRSVYVRAK